MFYRERYKRLLFLIPAGIIVVSGLTGIIARNIDMVGYNFNKIENEIPLNIPSGATVMGSPLYYFAFLEKPQNRFITYLFVEERCPDFESTVREQGVDYILVDSIMMNLLSAWCSSSYWKNEVMKFLTTRTSFVSVIGFEYPNGLASNRFLQSVYLVRVNQ
jgi:hypothetical protein